MRQAGRADATTAALASTFLASSKSSARPRRAEQQSQDRPLPPTPPLPPSRRQSTPPPPKPTRKPPLVETVAPKDEPDWGSAENETPEDWECLDQDVAAGVSASSQKEDEDPASDIEDERNQCTEILKHMDALVAAETLREEERAASAGAKPAWTRLGLLVKVRRLMQMHVSGMATADDELDIKGQQETVDAEMQTDKTATSQTKTKLEKATKEEVKEEEVEEKKGRDESEEEIEYPVPQARKFMAAMGFKSCDEVKDGRTLVHICCQESQQRNVNIRCSSIQLFSMFKLLFNQISQKLSNQFRTHRFSRCLVSFRSNARLPAQGLTTYPRQLCTLPLYTLPFGALRSPTEPYGALRSPMGSPHTR